MRRPLPGFFRSTAMMARLYLRTLLRGKKSWAVAALVVLVLILAFIAPARSANNLAYNAFLRQMILGFMVQLIALMYGIAVVREEVEQRTLTYLLVRPLPRVTIVLGRWLAAVATVLIITVGTAALAHLIGAPDSRTDARSALGLLLPGVFSTQPTPTLVQVVVAVGLGAVYYTTAFTAIAVLLPRAFLFGLGYIFFWEFALPMVPTDAAALSMKFHLMSLVGLTSGISGFEIFKPPEVTVGESLVVLLGLTALLAAVSLWFFPKKEYLLAPDD